MRAVLTTCGDNFRRTLNRFLNSGSEADPGLLEFVRSRKGDIETLARRHRISDVRIFGSVARGDSHSSSDVDFLVDVPRDATLYDLSRFRRELAELLGVDVDVVSSHALLHRDRNVLDGAVSL